MKRRALLWGAAALALAALTAAVLAARGVRLPAPTGTQAVGRVTYRWTDTSRPEEATPAAGDYRAVVVHVWYPAEGATRPAAYLPEAARLRSTLAASPDFGPINAWAVDWVHAHAREGAPVATAEAAYPVLIFLPGNRTNAALYSALLEDLASHGYVVAAIDHPYDVAAALLPTGEVAAFAEALWPDVASGVTLSADPHAAIYRQRVEVRAQDALFVLGQLTQVDTLLRGRLDLERVAVLGHSVGGVAAPRACQLEPRLRACLNLDGLSAGRPFYLDEAGRGPAQPFLFITKRNERPAPTDAELAAWNLTREAWAAGAAEADARVTAAFESVAGGSYRVTLREAAHTSFTDAPLLRPTLLPNSKAARTTAAVREYVRAFLDHYVRERGRGSWPAEAAGGEVTVEAFNVGDRH